MSPTLDTQVTRQPTPAPARPDVSLIILSWNTKDYLLGCLRSIEETMDGLDYEVLVVDNDSADGSPEAARAGGFSRLKVIETGSNLGFAAGNNVGMRAAAGRYHVLINSDMVLKPGCVQEMVAFMDAHPKVGVASPRLRNSDGSSQTNCRREPHLLNHFGRAVFINSYLADPAYRGEATAEVEILAGAFWVARREAVDEVGLLDEDFFFYGEDLDWCHRFRAAGWQVCYHPKAEAIHFGGVSSGLDTDRFSIALLRGRLQLWEKYHGRASSLLYLLIALLYEGLRLGLCGLRWLIPGADRRAIATKAKQHTTGLRWNLSRFVERLVGRPTRG
jgi:GT2 family glycosyltransferase